MEDPQAGEGLKGKKMNLQREENWEDQSYVVSREKRTSFRVIDKGHMVALRRDIAIDWASMLFSFEETVKGCQYFCQQEKGGKRKEGVADDK